MGFIFRPANIVKKFWERVTELSPDKCWNWKGGCFASGYGRFWMQGKLRRAHRVSYELANGEIPESLHILHKCDNPLCVNPSHLFIGTHDDNMKDMTEKGRQKTNPHKGEDAPNSKLTKDQVRAIKHDDRLQRIIAAEYGVHQVLISRIKTGKAWTHI